MKGRVMTNQTSRPKEPDLEEGVDRLQERIDEMDRPDRSIPLPDDEDEGDGAGPVTAVVP
jgi:hypothetical protein